MNIALLGFGTVGKAVYNILSKKDLEILKKYSINIKYILVRNTANKNVDSKLLVTDYNTILNDDSIELVIEMMGASVSYEYMKLALLRGKHVITANKEVIANDYVELQKIANNNKVKLLFEAAVGGGIPIVHTLLNSAPFNKIYKIEGILNGTTNFILTSMHKEKIEFNDALKIAQIKGFAEADPTADLEGLDMVRKISILSMICYDSKIDINDVYHSGIGNVNKEIVEVVELLGYRLKFLSSSELLDNKLNISVEPVIVKDSDILANVDYEYNLVRYYGDGCGTQMMYGKGAGDVTANSIVFDLGLLLCEYNQSFMPENEYKCYGKLYSKSKYLVKIKDNINSKLIEKKMGKYAIIRDISGEEFNRIKDNICFHARIIN